MENVCPAAATTAEWWEECNANDVVITPTLKNTLCSHPFSRIFKIASEKKVCHQSAMRWSCWKNCMRHHFVTFVHSMLGSVLSRLSYSVCLKVTCSTQRAFISRNNDDDENMILPSEFTLATTAVAKAASFQCTHREYMHIRRIISHMLRIAFNSSCESRIHAEPNTLLMQRLLHWITI